MCSVLIFIVTVSLSTLFFLAFMWCLVRVGALSDAYSESFPSPEDLRVARSIKPSATVASSNVKSAGDELTRYADLKPRDTQYRINTPEEGYPTPRD